MTLNELDAWFNAFLKKEDFPMQARVEDHAGNYGIYSMNLRTIKRPVITQGGERNVQ